MIHRGCLPRKSSEPDWPRSTLLQSGPLNAIPPGNVRKCPQSNSTSGWNFGEKLIPQDLQVKQPRPTTRQANGKLQSSSSSPCTSPPPTKYLQERGVPCLTCPKPINLLTFWFPSSGLFQQLNPLFRGPYISLFGCFKDHLFGP